MRNEKIREKMGIEKIRKKYGKKKRKEMLKQMRKKGKKTIWKRKRKKDRRKEWKLYTKPSKNREFITKSQNVLSQKIQLTQKSYQTPKERKMKNSSFQEENHEIVIDLSKFATELPTITHKLKFKRERKFHGKLFA